jgi:hypothetical protein
VKRFLPIVLLAVGFGLWSWLSPKAPHDQDVEILLGDRAANIDDVTVRYAPEHQVTFHYAHGSAPRAVRHAPRLPDGDYAIDIETSGSNGVEQVHRNVRLEEGRSTQIHAEDVK